MADKNLSSVVGSSRISELADNTDITVVDGGGNVEVAVVATTGLVNIVNDTDNSFDRELMRFFALGTTIGDCTLQITVDGELKMSVTGISTAVPAIMNSAFLIPKGKALLLTTNAVTDGTYDAGYYLRKVQ
tara:strand:- start:239 stop:631 length:393 start_codon:yes stop_codon:yes gene_type:complete